MSRCRKCGRPVTWEITGRGKRRPLNPDGTVHFSTCTGKPLKRRPSQHTPKQRPALIDDWEGCPEGCTGGWVAVERDGQRGVVPCPVHRKSA